MATSSTSRLLANARTYFMKALHHQLPVVVKKCLYNKCYPSVLCLYCGDVESSDHVFFCKVDNSAHSWILESHVASWKALTGLSLFSSVVMQLLSSCASDFPVFVVLCKGFVFNNWFCKAVSMFCDPKIAGLEVVKFVRSLSLAFRDGVWMVRAKHHAYMEKAKLIPLDGSTPVSVSGLVSGIFAGVVKLLGIAEAILSLGNSLTNAFHHRSGTPKSLVLGEPNYLRYVSSLQHYEIAFINQPHNWSGAKWLDSYSLGPIWFELSVWFLDGVSFLPVCSLFLNICDFTDVLQSCKFGIINDGLLCTAGAAVFFENISMSLNIEAIALALECVFFSYSVDLFLNSQAALDAYKSELELVHPDFRNYCWIECCYIVSVIYHKNLNINWHKIKDHSDVLGNEHADELARTVALSNWHLPYLINECYLRVNSVAIFDNSKHFVQDVFQSVYCLSVAMCKWFYNKHYSSVMYLFCDNIKVLNHVFSCLFDAAGYAQFLDIHASAWGVYFSLIHSSLGILQLLFTCVFSILVNIVLCKSFVFKNWFHESVSIFTDFKIATFMEKNGLIPHDGSVSLSISGLSSVLSTDMARLLSIAETIGIGFKFCKLCLFFLGINKVVSVYIDV
ncbi:hypothetical protein G9A89_010048 [Geosiphon pyriformis]|nr:hypothetical protein G9A89_010048 [Geosiphon pyriformis]